MNIKKQALKYMGYKNSNVDDFTNDLLDTCYSELQEIVNFKVIYKIFDYEHNSIDNISLNYNDLNKLLVNCKKIIVIACSLGIEIEKRIKLYSKVDMSKAVVLDALASAYLEKLCDDYEEGLNLEERTFRYAPGYGDVPLILNKELAKLLNIHKNIGVSIQDNFMFIPSKSMLGIIGIGKSKIKKSCDGCVNYDNCIFRKDNTTCY